jgi:exosortase
MSIRLDGHRLPIAGAALAAGGLFAALFGGVFADLVRDWAGNDDYSHGFLVLPVAIWIAFRQRNQLVAAASRPSALGLLVVAASLLVLVVGTVGVDLFLTRISMLGVLVGTVLFLGGWSHLRLLAFPLGFMLLMIPLPAVVFNQLAFPLQLIASRFGVEALRLLDIPVLREGNVIILANTTLEVAEACSGIRSLVSLITLAILYGYFTDSRAPVRVALTLGAVPIAIVANGLRVAGTGIAAHYYGATAATGFFHGFSGWFVFASSFLMLMGLSALVGRLAPATAPPLPLPATAVRS